MIIELSDEQADHSSCKILVQTNLSRRVLYIAGGRSVSGNDPGRKITSIIGCWQMMGQDIKSVFGKDLMRCKTTGSDKDFGHVSHYRQWYRRTGILDPLIHTLSEWRDIQHDAAMARHLESVSESFKPDLIWERSCRLHCAGLVTARRLGVPYVLEWKDHLVDYRFSLFRGKALRMERRKNREADYLVVESGVLRDQLEREGVDSGKIIVAHNAVDADEFKRDPQKRIQTREALGVDDETVLVGYLGSYAFYHDTARLVLAADRIRKSDITGKLKILMVGAGKEYPDSRKLAEHFGLLDSILIMKPGVPKDEVPGLLAALDIAVLPGSTDIICPIKIQEYMAAELATVAPDYACNREVIQDGDTGILFEPKNETDLAEKIIALARNSELRKRMGQQAREVMIKQFSWEATWGAALETILSQTQVKANSADKTRST